MDPSMYIAELLYLLVVLSENYAKGRLNLPASGFGYLGHIVSACCVLNYHHIRVGRSSKQQLATHKFLFLMSGQYMYKLVRCKGTLTVEHLRRSNKQYPPAPLGCGAVVQ